ncbi:MAG: hypothetical protein N2Z74_03805 [Syntrophales bacterium]|nr:hypothetical protein [Syntrophales bacterium]
MRVGKNRGYLQEGGGTSWTWLVTFNDLLTLLVTFFALLLAFSTPRQAFLTQAADSFRKVWGISQTVEKEGTAIPAVVKPLRDRDIETEKTKKIIESKGRLETMKREILAWQRGFPYLSSTAGPLAITVEAPAAVFFIPASVELTEKATAIMKDIGDILRRAGAFVRVEVRHEEGEKTARGISRAAVLADYLVLGVGIPPERVSLAAPTMDRINSTGDDGRIVLVISPAKL